MKTPLATKMSGPPFQQKHSAAELLLERRALRVMFISFLIIFNRQIRILQEKWCEAPLLGVEIRK
jgi:hypothetical protein